MGSKQSYIEINGKQYDPVTGVIVGKPAKASAGRPKVLDGFISQKRPVSGTAKAPVVAKTQSSKHPVHKQRPHPQKAHTLVRGAVKKPASSNKVSRASAASTVAAPTLTTSVGQRPDPAARIEPERAARAHRIGKSNLITRFGSGAMDVTSSIIKKTVPMSVRPAPPQTTATATKSTKQSKSTAKADPFDAAVQNARSHEQAAPKKKRLHHKVAKKLGVKPRTLGVSMAVLAIIALGGFYAYQSVPNFAMQMAATRAGVDAAIPSYKPSGFALNRPIQYSPGAVTISFTSRTDDRAFKISQRTSNWNSDALLTNVVVASNKPYQTFEDKGRTIYIYDTSNATWVNGGVWYQIEGNSQLTSEQLVHIASSM